MSAWSEEGFFFNQSSNDDPEGNLNNETNDGLLLLHNETMAFLDEYQFTVSIATSVLLGIMTLTTIIGKTNHH